MSAASTPSNRPDDDDWPNDDDAGNTPPTASGSNTDAANKDTEKLRSCCVCRLRRVKCKRENGSKDCVGVRSGRRLDQAKFLFGEKSSSEHIAAPQPYRYDDNLGGLTLERALVASMVEAHKGTKPHFTLADLKFLNQSTPDPLSSVLQEEQLCDAGFISTPPRERFFPLLVSFMFHVSNVARRIGERITSVHAQREPFDEAFLQQTLVELETSQAAIPYLVRSCSALLAVAADHRGEHREHLSPRSKALEAALESLTVCTEPGEFAYLWTSRITAVRMPILMDLIVDTVATEDGGDVSLGYTYAIKLGALKSLLAVLYAVGWGFERLSRGIGRVQTELEAIERRHHLREQQFGPGNRSETSSLSPEELGQFLSQITNFQTEGQQLQSADMSQWVETTGMEWNGHSFGQ
ncbi:Zn(2)-C7 fungal-type transcription factor [Pseudohyphozyma bogoriensis]|nr:Zn(2)-C7 fungal-type transcription factor [Pseudohyphozyma bogoriensis]